MATKRSRKFRWKQEWFVEPIGEDSNRRIAERLGGDPIPEDYVIEVEGEKIEVYKCSKAFLRQLKKSPSIFYRSFVRHTQNVNPKPDPHNARLPLETGSG
jgi:hypothetical protein